MTMRRLTRVAMYSFINASSPSSKYMELSFSLLYLGASGNRLPERNASAGDGAKILEGLAARLGGCLSDKALTGASHRRAGGTAPH